MNFCVPKSVPPTVKTSLNSIFENFKMAMPGGGTFFLDIYNTGAAVGVSFAMGLIYCLLFIYLMSFFAEVISWICIVLVQIGIIGASVLFWYNWYLTDERIKAFKAQNPGETELKEFEKSANSYK